MFKEIMQVSTSCGNAFMQAASKVVTAYQSLMVPIPKNLTSKAQSGISRVTEPIDTSPGRLAGLGRNSGAAKPEVQQQVIQRILEQSKGLPTSDRAWLLATAKLESGFNPDAANPNSSAVGIFQIIRPTAKGLNVSHKGLFDADLNIQAGIRLLREYKGSYAKMLAKEPSLASQGSREEWLYALHHDGPSLNSGGLALAKKNITPRLQAALEVVRYAEAREKSTAAYAELGPDGA